MTLSRSFIRLLAGVLGSLALAGCASPLAPDRASLREPEPSIALPIGHPGAADPKGGFYPLRLGNRWDYAISNTMTLVAPDAPPQPTTWAGTMHRELICTERIGGLEYFVEQGLVVYDNARTTPQWIRYRQDAKGLFEADVALSTAPACATVSPAVSGRPWSPASEVASLTRDRSERVRAAFEAAALRLEGRLRQIETLARSTSLAGGASTADGTSPELVRLSYPLVAGTRWFIRTDPPFEAIAERFEMVHVRAGSLMGWRIRIVPPGLGERDRVYVWYGRAGYLGLRAHVEMDAVDIEGNVVGRWIADQREILTAYHLKGSGGRGVRPADVLP
jgi:hypothetical protein